MHLQSYIQQTGKMQMSAWVSERKTKEQRKGFNSQQVTLPESQYSSQNSQCSCVSQGTKCCPEERSDCLQNIRASIFVYFLFFPPSSWNTETVSNIRQSYLMTKPRTNACIIIIFLSHNIELAYKGRQITKLKSHVRCNPSHIHQRGRGESTA